MTICVAIKVIDGIVFAADSAVSWTKDTDKGIKVDNVWKHGHKVFNLHRNFPLVGMCSGLAHFGPNSINYLAKDLRIILEENIIDNTYDFKQVVDYAFKFFKDVYQKSQPNTSSTHSFEFWIGGYDFQIQNGEIWKFEIQPDNIQKPEPLVLSEDHAQILWGGQGQAINRLVLGYDPRIPQKFNLEDLELEEFETPLVEPSMPLQDAIDLAKYLVEMTKTYFAFLPGANIVAGETDIATVTKHEGFKWINRKHYYPAELNRRNIDHVTRLQ